MGSQLCDGGTAGGGNECPLLGFGVLTEARGPALCALALCASSRVLTNSRPHSGQTPTRATAIQSAGMSVAWCAARRCTSSALRELSSRPQLATGHTSSESLLGESSTLGSFAGGEQGECTFPSGDEADDDGEALIPGDGASCPEGGVDGDEASTEA